MDKIQKEVKKKLLQNEKEILNKLKENYTKSLAEIKQKIKELQSSELTQSKIYQIQYQENLEKQVSAIIDILSNENINNINDYLVSMYQDSFIGSIYHMQSEGLPFIMSINQEAVLKSISKTTDDFKLSTKLYENADKLKRQIQDEISRGISQAFSYGTIARNISSYTEADLNKAYRIARTEGGRVETEASFEAIQRAKNNGADIVKEWDSTIDKRTRETHAMLDGQIREINQPFEVDGKTAMYPHGFGLAEEDINCRCTLLERAKWAIDDNEEFTKMIDGDLKEFKNIKNYESYKKKYFDFYNNKESL